MRNKTNPIVLSLFLLLLGAAFSSAASYTFANYFQKGWNLVSFPIDNVKYLGGCDIATIAIPGQSFSPFYSWNGKEHIPAGNLHDGNLRVKGGQGYWIYAPVGCTAQFSGYRLFTEYRNQPLSAGWNLIGATNQPIPFKIVSSNCKYKDYHFFEFSKDGAFVTATTLEPGKGYSLYLDSKCTLNGPIRALNGIASNKMIPPSMPKAE